MIVPWKAEDAASWTGELGQLKYASHLMMLNVNQYGPFFQVSVKSRNKNIFNQSEEILHYTDYHQITPTSYSHQPKTETAITNLAVEPLKKLLSLEAISTEQIILALANTRLSPLEKIPSAVAILHALIPHQVIIFCQPVNLLGLACTEEGMALLAQEVKEPLSSIPLMIPGLELARKCLQSLNANASVSRTVDIQIIILNGQGVLVLGENLGQVFKKLSVLIDTTHSIINRNKNHEDAVTSSATPHKLGKTNLSEVACMRKEISISAGHPLIMHCIEFALGEIPDPFNNDSSTLAIQSFASAAPQTRIKAMVGRDINRFKEIYTQFANNFLTGISLEQDLSPRIILDPPSRLFALGQSAAEALLTQELFLSDQHIRMVAQKTGIYQPLPIRDLVQYEAFCLEEKMLLHLYQNEYRSGKVFQGEISLVTGGASGIGKACVQALLEHGAAVISLDINPAVINQFASPEYLGLVCDLTNEMEVITAFGQAALDFGGLDMLVLNAGVFPAGCRIESLSLEEWQRVMRINLDSNLIVLREAHTLLKHSPNGGRVLVNASKNVLAPGAGAAAYSASKAAVTQMARVAALEWGKDHIRVNMIHPDAIFDTGIWTEEVIQARAAHYGMSVQQYKTRNILGVELNSRYVAELVVEMLGPRFEKITGAQIPVDGGSDRVI